MNFAKKQRLKMIDSLLIDSGQVNRADLMERFEIQEATATRDFATYKALSPGNVVYNPSKRAYFKTDNFKPLFEVG